MLSDEEDELVSKKNAEMLSDEEDELDPLTGALMDSVMSNFIARLYQPRIAEIEYEVNSMILFNTGRASQYERRPNFFQQDRSKQEGSMLLLKLKRKYLKKHELQDSPWLKQKSFSNNRFVELQIERKSTSGNKNSYNKESIENIFQVRKDNFRVNQKIFVVGNAGNGKSTFCWHLAREWANEKQFMKEFNFVFVIPLRELRNLTLQQYLENEYSVDGVQSILSTIKFKKVLLILDGLDETQGKSQIFREIDDMENAFNLTVILTSRQSEKYTKDLGDFEELKINGFDSDGVNEFIQLYFETYISQGKELPNTTILFSTENIKSLSHCPLFLGIFCLNIESNPSSCKLPKTQTELFKYAINSTVEQYCRKRSSQSTKQIDLFQTTENELIKEYIRHFSNFGYLALKSLQNNTMIFTKQEIQKAQCDLLIVFGFLVRINNFEEEEMYEVFHGSFIEFFISFYLKNLFFEDKTKFKEIFSALMFEFEASMILPFLFALMEEKVTDVIQEFPFENFYQEKNFFYLFKEFSKYKEHSCKEPIFSLFDSVSDFLAVYAVFNKEGIKIFEENVETEQSKSLSLQNTVFMSNRKQLDYCDFKVHANNLENQLSPSHSEIFGHPLFKSICLKFLNSVKSEERKSDHHCFTDSQMCLLIETIFQRKPISLVIYFLNCKSCDLKLLECMISSQFTSCQRISFIKCHFSNKEIKMISKLPQSGKVKQLYLVSKENKGDKSNYCLHEEMNHLSLNHLIKEIRNNKLTEIGFLNVQIPQSEINQLIEAFAESESTEMLEILYPRSYECTVDLSKLGNCRTKSLTLRNIKVIMSKDTFCSLCSLSIINCNIEKTYFQRLECYCRRAHLHCDNDLLIELSKMKCSYYATKTLTIEGTFAISSELYCQLNCDFYKCFSKWDLRSSCCDINASEHNLIALLYMGQRFSLDIAMSFHSKEYQSQLNALLNYLFHAKCRIENLKVESAIKYLYLDFHPQRKKYGIQRKERLIEVEEIAQLVETFYKMYTFVSTGVIHTLRIQLYKQQNKGQQMRMWTSIQERLKQEEGISIDTELNDNVSKITITSLTILQPDKEESFLLKLKQMYLERNPAQNELWLRKKNLTNHQFIDLQIKRKNTNGNKRSNDIVAIEDILKSRKNNAHSNKIFVEGNMGYGKSAFCWHIAQEWANEKQFMKQFALVFLIPLKQLGKLTIQKYIEKHYSFDGIESVLKTVNSKKVLVILDGLDEMQRKLPIFGEIAELRKEFFLTVILTSRPIEGCMKELEDFEEFRLDGFDNNGKKKFLQHHFSNSTISNINSLFPTSFQKLLHSPLLLGLLGLLTDNKLQTSQIFLSQLPKAQTQLFKEVVESILQQYFRQYSNEPNIKIDLFQTTDNELLKECVTNFNNFGALALKSLQNDQMIFTQEEIESAHCDLLIILGFLIRINNFEEEMYEVIHGSFLEFFISFYLKNLFFEDKTKFKEIVSALMSQFESSMILPFLFGLMEDKVTDIIQEFSFKSFYQMKNFSYLFKECGNYTKKICSLFDSVSEFLSVDAGFNKEEIQIFQQKFNTNQPVSSYHSLQNAKFASNRKRLDFCEFNMYSNLVHQKLNSSLLKVFENICFDHISVQFYNVIKLDKVFPKLDKANHECYSDAQMCHLIETIFQRKPTSLVMHFRNCESCDLKLLECLVSSQFVSLQSITFVKCRFYKKEIELISQLPHNDKVKKLHLSSDLYELHDSNGYECDPTKNSLLEPLITEIRNKKLTEISLVDITLHQSEIDEFIEAVIESESIDVLEINYSGKLTPLTVDFSNLRGSKKMEIKLRNLKVILPNDKFCKLLKLCIVNCELEKDDMQPFEFFECAEIKCDSDFVKRLNKLKNDDWSCRELTVEGTFMLCSKFHCKLVWDCTYFNPNIEYRCSLVDLEKSEKTLIDLFTSGRIHPFTVALNLATNRYLTHLRVILDSLFQTRNRQQKSKSKAENKDLYLNFYPQRIKYGIQRKEKILVEHEIYQLAEYLNRFHSFISTGIIGRLTIRLYKFQNQGQQLRLLSAIEEQFNQLEGLSFCKDWNCKYSEISITAPKLTDDIAERSDSPARSSHFERTNYRDFVEEEDELSDESPSFQSHSENDDDDDFYLSLRENRFLNW